ncbi:unnamed protein product, partial [Ectocarpus fasciculatus]
SEDGSSHHLRSRGVAVGSGGSDDGHGDNTGSASNNNRRRGGGDDDDNDDGDSSGAGGSGRRAFAGRQEGPSDRVLLLGDRDQHYPRRSSDGGAQGRSRPRNRSHGGGVASSRKGSLSSVSVDGLAAAGSGTHRRGR